MPKPSPKTTADPTAKKNPARKPVVAKEKKEISSAAKKRPEGIKAKKDKPDKEPQTETHAIVKKAKTPIAPPHKKETAQVEVQKIQLPEPALHAEETKPVPTPVEEKKIKIEAPDSKSPVVIAKPVSQPEQAAPPAQERLIHLKPPIVVKDLATRLSLKPFQLIHHLMEMNVFATLTQTIQEDVARSICEKLGYTLELEKREKGAGQVHAPPKVVEVPKPPPAPAEHLASRPPVITFMGHVDHGKTSLLDAIRKTRVAAGEAGGITQHIGAYTVERNGHRITFLDTPGHEAFTGMRARGANITDMVVLVVAADDGLMPQTLEAISHARAAHVPILVAINKVDLPGANLIKVKAQLQEQNLAPEEYGGQTICCEVSATRNIGIDKLLDMMLLQSEMMELKANPKGPARGRVIESQTEMGRGPTCTVLIQSGTLQVGNMIIAGPHSGRVKALVNDLGKNIKEAGPSMPVKLIGLDGVPMPGEEILVLDNDREMKQLAEERTEKLRTEKLEAPPRVTLENLFETIEQGQRKTLRIVLRGDVQGSVEAISTALHKIESKKVDLDILQESVGVITESDILLAKASGAVVIGFNTRTDNTAATTARREHVQIKLYSIIYELIDQVKEAMAGLLEPELRETKVGHAIVKKVFDLSKFPVAGCLVQNGRMVKAARARVLRRGQPIYDGAFLTLKRFQDEVGEVRSGVECGIRLGNFTDYHEEDIIECYQLDKFPQSL